MTTTAKKKSMSAKVPPAKAASKKGAPILAILAGGKLPPQNKATEFKGRMRVGKGKK
jgi:hypothetical protein